MALRPIAELRRRFLVGRAITWWAFVARDGNCPVEEYLRSRSQDDQNKVNGKLSAMADQGWGIRAQFFKRLTLPESLSSKGVPIFEIKSFQDRVLLMRDGLDGVLLLGMVKKDDWSQRDARELERAVNTATDYLERKEGKK